MKPTNFKFVLCSLRVSAHIIGSVYTNGFLKVWLGIPASNRNWGSQSPFCYHYNNPQYTNRFIHPTYGNRYGLWGFRRQSWISTSAYTAQRKGGFKLMHYQPHIRCNIAYTPWPSAYCPPHVPLFTSATLHHKCSLFWLYPFGLFGGGLLRDKDGLINAISPDCTYLFTHIFL